MFIFSFHPLFNANTQFDRNCYETSLKNLRQILSVKSADSVLSFQRVWSPIIMSNSDTVDEYVSPMYVGEFLSSHRQITAPLPTYTHINISLRIDPGIPEELFVHPELKMSDTLFYYHVEPYEAFGRGLVMTYRPIAGMTKDGTVFPLNGYVLSETYLKEKIYGMLSAVIHGTYAASVNDPYEHSISPF